MLYYEVPLQKDLNSPTERWRYPITIPTLAPNPLYTSPEAFIHATGAKPFPAKDAPVSWDNGSVYMTTAGYSVLEPVDYTDIYRYAQTRLRGDEYYLNFEDADLVEQLQTHYGEFFENAPGAENASPRERSFIEEFVYAVRQRYQK